MNCPTNLKVAALAGAAAISLFWQPASAQTTPSGTGASNQIEEVVVTARKREENLQKIPIAVTAVTAESLQQHQVTDYYSLQKLVPTLVVTGLQGQQDNFAIRGVGTAVFGVQVEQSVGLVIDDVPIGLPGLYMLEPYDLSRIEVLRGPQGMLFGKNASAGLIHIVTNDPDLDETEFDAHAEYRNMNTPGGGNREKVDLAVNLPLSDDAALRATGYFLHDDQLLENVNSAEKNEFLGNEQGGIRAKLLWEPTARLKVVVSGDYTHQDGPGGSLESYRYSAPGSILLALNQAVGITPGPDNLKFASATRDSSSQDLYGASVNASYDVGGGYTLTDVVAYRHLSTATHADKSFLPGSLGLDDLDPAPATSRESQFSNELRFSSPADQRLTYQVGLFYQEFHSFGEGIGATDLGITTPGTQFNTFCNLVPIFGGACPQPKPAGLVGYSDAFSSTTLNSFSYAAFGEGQYKITDDLSLTFGARYTKDRKNYDYLNVDLPDSFTCQTPAFGPLAGAVFVNGCNFYPSENHFGKAQADNISGRGSLDYTIAPDVMAYFSYGRGYKGPGFDTGQNAFAGSGPVLTVKPELSTNYELGLKSQFFDHRLQLNGDLFDDSFHNFQTQTFACDVPPGSPAGTPCVTTLRTTNAGELKSKGADVELTAIPVDHLTLTGGVSYLDAQYHDLIVPCYPNQPVGPLTTPGFCTSPIWALGQSNAEGNQLNQAPKWTTDLSLRYDMSLWSGWGGFIQGDMNYRTSFNFWPSEDPHTRLPASTIFDLSVGAKTDDDRIALTFFVKNLTDQRIPNFIYIAGEGQLVGDSTGALGAIRPSYVQEFSPDSFRQFGISLDYHL